MKTVALILIMMACFDTARAQNKVLKPAAVNDFNIANVKDTIPVVNNFFVLPLAGNYYAKHLSFFCKMEWKAEKKIKIPLRLRLGSVEYTDYMEKKPGTYFFGK